MKDLNYYLDAGLELPTDPETLDKLMNGESIDFEEKPAEAITEDMTPTPIVKTEEPKTPVVEAPKVEATTEAKDPDGVVAQDGKHVLPFAVLQNTRARANALEAKTAELTAEIERLKAGKDATQASETSFTEEELAAMEDEGPVFAKLAKAVRLQQEQIAKLMESANASTKATEDDAQTKRATTVQEAIDQNAELAKWQSATDEDPDGAARWGHAVTVDETLRNLPAWKDKPAAERFAEVQRRVQVDFGDQVTTQPDRQKSGDPVPIKKPAATASKKGDGSPETLSDMPGGLSPDAAVNIDSMDTSQIAAAMDKMTVEQITAMLAKVA